MEPTEGTKKQSAPSKTSLIIIALLVIVIVILAAMFFLRGNGGDGQKNDNMTINYAADASVMMDQNSLQAAIDEAAENAKNGNIGLNYVNDAYSEDGINFECMIANSVANMYDMYLQIFADAEMQDEVFLSGLVPPGSGFESITLEHALDPGDTTVYVVLTQVETSESGAQALVNQVVHTMDFHVVEPTEG